MQDGERSATLRRVGNSKSLGMMYHTVRGAHPDYVATDVLGDVMTIAPSGRLYKALVETKKASAVQAWDGAQTTRACSPSSPRFPTARRSSRARDAMLATFANVAKEPITEAEVARIRARAAQVFRRHHRRPAEVRRRDLRVDRARRLAICSSSSATSIAWSSLPTCSGSRSTISSARICTIGEFLPEAKPDRAPVPATVDVAAMVKDYKGDAATATGEAFDPTPANLDARTQRFTLANGMKVALLPKKTRGEAVSFNVSLHFGDEKSVFGKASTATIAGSMLAARHDANGRGRRSRMRSTSCAPRSASRARRWAPAPPARPIARSCPRC